LTVEIVLLAMVALFVGLRLYAVLGQRTGHEQQPVTRPEPATKPEAIVPVSDPAPAGESAAIGLEKVAAAGLRQLIAADPSFDTTRFLDGAQAAYQMILEAFWRGDSAALDGLVADDVRAAFEEAIAERETAGHKLDNRLIGIERAAIESAQVEKKVATIEVRFDAYIASVTRTHEGEVVAGSLSDAVATQDIWTFRRTLNSNDPNWVLIETDQAGE
jgi:predicted lipid-binding transport protein (Tim44 family)